MVDDLKWAHEAFKAGRQRAYYLKCCSYYDGWQPMTFATDKFRSLFFDVFGEYSENLCAPVVDSLKDRLRVTGFQSSNSTLVDTPAQTPMGVSFQTKTLDDPEGVRAWDIWTNNRLDLRSIEVHEESLKTGDGYVIVWPREDGTADIVPQIPEEIRVQYASDNSKRMLRAAKMWYEEEEAYWRLTLYLEDHIEKYVARTTNQSPPMNLGSWLPYEPDIANPYGRVPVFHFPNNKEGKYGVTELRDVFPIQDALNKSVVDMLVTMEFASYKQRYIIGFEPEIDPDTGEPVDQNVRNYGQDRIMTIPDPEAKVGQFDATDLNQFLKVQDKFWQAASRVTGTPLHYFFITQGDFPSGEAIKSAEGRFIKKIGDQQTAKGNIWEDVIKFAMKIEGGVQDDLKLSTLWQDATPKSEAELADTAVKKKAVGVPRSQLLREQGYSEDQIPDLLAESDSEMLVKMKTEAELNQQQQAPAAQPTRSQTRANQGVPGGGGS